MNSQSAVLEATAYKSPLHQMTQTTATCLWNDSAALSELRYSIEHGATGATCKPSTSARNSRSCWSCVPRMTRPRHTGS